MTCKKFEDISIFLITINLNPIVELFGIDCQNQSLYVIKDWTFFFLHLNIKILIQEMYYFQCPFIITFA